MSSRTQKAQGFTLIELLVVVGIIGILIGSAVTFYVSYKRGSCDEAAAADLANLGQAFQQWRVEVSQMNCDVTTIRAGYWTEALGSGVNIMGLVGPYYHWNGTNSKCDVRVRTLGNATAPRFQAAAWLGSHPQNDDRRWLFELTVTGSVVTRPTNEQANPRDAGWYSLAVGPGTAMNEKSLFDGKTCADLD